MPGDFGSYRPGWFWVQVEMSVLDLSSGNDTLSRKWGQFLHAFAPVTKAISWGEVGDSGPDHPVRETLKHLPELKKRLADIESHVRRYQEPEAAGDRHGEGAT